MLKKGSNQVLCRLLFRGLNDCFYGDVDQEKLFHISRRLDGIMMIFLASANIEADHDVKEASLKRAYEMADHSFKKVFMDAGVPLYYREYIRCLEIDKYSVYTALEICKSNPGGLFCEEQTIELSHKAVTLLNDAFNSKIDEMSQGHPVMC